MMALFQKKINFKPSTVFTKIYHKHIDRVSNMTQFVADFQQATVKFEWSFKSMIE